MNDYLNSPRVSPLKTDPRITQRPVNWTKIVIAAIGAGTVISVTDILRKEPSRPAPQPVIQQAIPVPPTNQPPLVAPTPAPLAMPLPTPVLVVRAQPIEPMPVVRRASLVEGQFFAIQMPDGSVPLIRYMGNVANFDQLPRNPNLYDLWHVGSSGHSWVFMQPVGFSAPAWVDP
jgi:hypothetical protein